MSEIFNVKDMVYESFGECEKWALYTQHGRITVLDRMTGWGGGIRDIESGFTDNDDKFWLASGNFDVRKFDGMLIKDVIGKIKENANTCVPILD